LNEDGRPWRNNLLRRFKRCLALAGITSGDVTIHTLRHTFATHMLLRGANPKVVSELLGHASIQFTFDTYGHVFPQDRWAAVSKLPFGGTQRAQEGRGVPQVAALSGLMEATA
ncbi:tyrosine-type recombinase/integrase, partial [bacterium]|nr:tyrosine-type recombinase/integrase [bacterium]